MSLFGFRCVVSCCFCDRCVVLGVGGGGSLMCWLLFFALAYCGVGVFVFRVCGIFVSI